MSDLSSKAYSRLNLLLDSGSFVEIGKCVTARSTDFNLDEKKAPGDGVITGYGTIDSQLVYVYSQDASILGGTIGEMHAKKISHIYEMAMKMGAPVIGLLDCGGIRLEESFDALDGLGSIYSELVKASGVIPTICGVLGQAGGGLSLVAGMSDFVFMSNEAKLFVNAPNTLDGVKEEKDDTSDVSFQSGAAGNVDFTGSEDEVLSGIRSLITILPSNNLENMSYTECTDDLNRTCNAAAFAGDSAMIARDISDNHVFFECKPEFAQDMVTGFIRLNGVTVGLIGNRSKVFADDGTVKEELSPVLTTKGCRKAADFVKFCDAFGISIVSLTNVEGFKANRCEEHKLNRALSYLVSSFASATVAKVNVVTGKAYGSAYVAMNSKAIGADIVFAWNDASIGMMDAKMASRIMYNGADADTLSAKAKEYEDLQSNIEKAASHGYVDTIIDAQDTRKYVIGALEMLFTKSEVSMDKKHLSI